MPPSAFRRPFALLARLTAFAFGLAGAALAERAPNVLFIAVDDLNDWVGPLDGHPAVRTPALDRLAERGTTFLNAHCQAPICNPSRVAVLTGLRPSNTGVYGLTPGMRQTPAVRERPTLLQWFAERGYRTYSSGKVDHHGFRASGGPGPEVNVLGPAGGPGDIFPERKHAGPTPMGNNPWMDWGAHPHDESLKGDHQVASWAIERLGDRPDDRPFFMALGFFLPHVPAYVTPPWLEAVPTEGVLPLVKEDDRDDVPPFAWYLHWYVPEPRLSWMRENEQWLPFVRAYLASINWVDTQIGRVLDALEASGEAERTIVVLWSDNGMHLGEKGITGKNSLWERATRVPLIFAGPGITAGARVSSPAELIDIHPTLIELAGLEPRSDLDGESLVRQLRDPQSPRERPAITTSNPGNHSVRSERYRYIRYADGSEEFYDHLHDPNEWRNLAGAPQYAALLGWHRRWLPTEDHPHLPGRSGRILEYDPTAGTLIWEGKVIPPGSPPPEK